MFFELFQALIGDRRTMSRLRLERRAPQREGRKAQNRKGLAYRPDFMIGTRVADS